MYIDDIILVGRSRGEHLEGVISHLQKTGLRVNLEKLKFYKTQVEFLCHIITLESILPNPEKITTTI